MIHAGHEIHPDTEQIERYSMGQLAEPELGAVEEHLLVCKDCRDGVDDTDHYVRAVRSACADWPARRPVFRFFSMLSGPTWAAAAVALAFLAIRPGPFARQTQPVAVALEASRGAEGSLYARVPAGKPLAISMDLGETAPGGQYQVEIVDEAGRPVGGGTALPGGGKLTMTGPQLGAGRYYVRLYAPNRELLREYGLTAEK